MTVSSTVEPPIRWRQVLCLAALQAAIVLMWIVYRAYLPDLLAQMGWSPHCGDILLFLETAVAIACHPIMGNLSDQRLMWMGSRFPFIALGIILASALFLLIPALAIFGNPESAVRWVFMFVLVTWAIAMTVFHSPAFSLLIKYSAIPALPLAASLLVFAQSLMGAIAPTVKGWILAAGAPIAFGTGSLALILVAFVLRMVDIPDGVPLHKNLPETENPPDDSAPAQPLRVDWRSPVLIAGVGMGIAISARLVMGNFGPLFTLYYTDGNVGQLMQSLGLGLAVLTVPMGWLASKMGIRRSLVPGLVLTLIMTGVIISLQQVILFWIGVGVLVLTLSLIFNSAFPSALTAVPSLKAGLGLGCYLGGLTAGNFWLDLQAQGNVTLGLAVSWGVTAIAILFSLLCIWQCPQPTQS